VIRQYPHIATVILVTNNGRDAKGYPVAPSENVITITCRAEPNSSNAIIKTADGTAYNYRFVVYMPLGQADVPIGSRVTQITFIEGGQILFTDDGSAINADNNNSIVTGAGNPVSGNGIVKMFSRGQLNARLWL
jgi:hypothetical protein